MRAKLLATAAAIGALFFLAGTADALTVSIGIASCTGSACTVGSIDTVETNNVADGAASYNTGSPIAPLTFAEISGSGSPVNSEPFLISSTTEIQTKCAACTISIFVTETDLTFPTPTANYNIANTSLNVDWLSELGATAASFGFWVDPSNGAYTGTEFDSYTAPNTSGVDIFSGAPGFPLAPLVDTGTGPFSQTLEYTLTFANCTATTKGYCEADLSSQMDAVVPEPASLTLLGSALLGFGAWYRRRNKAA